MKYKGEKGPLVDPNLLSFWKRQIKVNVLWRKDDEITLMSLTDDDDPKPP